MIAREVATAMLTGGARCSWFLTVLALSAVVAGQQGSEGDGCADHAGCGTGLYCTRAEECGLCRDDDEQPCQLWADSIDGSCTVCGDSSDPTPGSTDASAIAPEPSITDNDAGRELRRTERKAGRRKAGRRNQAAQKRSAADDTRIDERSVALPNFVAVSGAFNTDEVDRLRREGALVPAVHSNAGVQGKRNMGTKESEIRGLSRERFGWVYDKMRKLVHEANAAHWNFEQLGEVSDSLQIATYHASVGGKYEWHVDQNLWGASIHAPRILSVTVQLTPVAEDGEAAGGRLFVGGDVPDLAQGTAVVFPSYMPHRVEPVRKGSREAMIAFFEGSDGRFERLAKRALSSAVLAWPEQHKLRTLLGEAQVETGELAEALQTLVLAAKHDDEQQQTGARDFHTLDMLGVAMYLSGRLPEAEAAFAQAKAANPELATGYAKLGSTLMRHGRQEEAASCYGIAISSAEQADSRMLYNKGTLHMQLGQGDEAMEMFRGAIAVDPAHVKAMGNLAAVLAASKRHAEAVVLLERALTTLTDTAQGKLPADLAVALGGAYEAASASDEEPASSSTRLQAAHRAYRRALRAHPSHSGAKAHLARLVRSATISYSFAKFSA